MYIAVRVFNLEFEVVNVAATTTTTIFIVLILPQKKSYKIERN